MACHCEVLDHLIIFLLSTKIHVKRTCPFMWISTVDHCQERSLSAGAESHLFCFRWRRNSKNIMAGTTTRTKNAAVIENTITNLVRTCSGSRSMTFPSPTFLSLWVSTAVSCDTLDHGTLNVVVWSDSFLLLTEVGVWFVALILALLGVGIATFTEPENKMFISYT